MLSAIIPVTDMSGRLHELSRWVRESTKIGIEIVLVHDFQDIATEDELIQIVKHNDSHLVKMVSQKLQSPGLARNLGLEHATGEWITFWDSDDLPEPSAYSQLVNELKEAKKEIGIGNFAVVNSINASTRLVRHRDSLVSTVNYPGVWRYVFKKSRIRRISFKRMRMGEDQLFLACLNINEAEVFFTSNCVYKYSMGHPKQLSSNQSARSELIQAINEMSLVIVDQHQSNLFAICLYIRLNLTLIKIGSSREKVNAALKIIAYFLRRKSRSAVIKVVRGLK